MDELSKIEGVEKAAGMLQTNVVDSSSSDTPNNFGYTLYGAKVDDLAIVGISNVNGSIFNEDSNELIVGKNLADEKNFTIGETVDIYGNEFKITGIYETGSILYDSAMYTSLKKLQNITDDEGKISSISIKIKNYPKYVISTDKFDFSQEEIIHQNLIDFLLNRLKQSEIISY